jgi:copper chaperone
MAQETLIVDGMSCGHCVETITNAVGKVAGVNKVVVNLDDKSVFVDFDESNISLDKISACITEVGFEVK